MSIFRNILYTLTKSSSRFHEIESRYRRSNLMENAVININNSNNSNNSEFGEFLQSILENITEHRPMARYGHAAARVPGGFVIFGGKSVNDTFLNDLWFYNVSGRDYKWKQLAGQSQMKPLAVARHTITFANHYLYVFGGSLQTGEFTSR